MKNYNCIGNNEVYDLRVEYVNDLKTLQYWLIVSLYLVNELNNCSDDGERFVKLEENLFINLNVILNKNILGINVYEDQSE